MSVKKVEIGAMVKLGIILALYAAVACVVLAFVYDGTAKIIAQRQQADLVAAIKELFPEADDFKPFPPNHIQSPDPAVTIEADGAYIIVSDKVVIGTALRTSRAGYNGAIKVLVGVRVDGKVCGVKILEHTETPGLGANAGSATYFVDRGKGIHFYDQFIGKSANDPFVPKQDVIAITASTITSRAVSNSVKAAVLATNMWLGGSK